MEFLNIQSIRVKVSINLWLIVFVLSMLNLKGQNLKVIFKTNISKFDVEKLIIKTKTNGQSEWAECNTARLVNGHIESHCFIGEQIGIIHIRVEYNGVGNYSRYFDSTGFVNVDNNYEVNLGVIKLNKEGIVKINNIVGGKTGNYRSYILTIKNPSAHEILITQVQIRAQNEKGTDETHFSDFSDKTLFEINEVVKITDFDGNVARGTTQYKMMLEGKGTSIPVTCDIGLNQKLSYSYLNLFVPCNVSVGPQKSRQVTIFFPNQFEAVFNKSLVKYKKLLKVKRMGDFKSFSFNIYYNEENSIKTAYKTYP